MNHKDEIIADWREQKDYTRSAYEVWQKRDKYWYIVYGSSDKEGCVFLYNKELEKHPYRPIILYCPAWDEIQCSSIPF